MPVDDIKPAEPMGPYIGNELGQRKKRPGYGNSQEQRKYASPKRSINDLTSFMGIPQDELTPAVSDAIISLMEEVDHLRMELTLTHSLEHMLSDNMDKHADLPVLTRHALGREISILCAHAARTQSVSTFVYFQIANSAEIKARAGLLAFERSLKDTAQVLTSQLRETDRIGTLGGDGFGILMALSNVEQAEEKTKKMIRQLQVAPVLYESHVIELEVAYGLHALHEEESVENVLRAADRDLHHRFVEI